MEKILLEEGYDVEEFFSTPATEMIKEISLFNPPPKGTQKATAANVWQFINQLSLG